MRTYPALTTLILAVCATTGCDRGAQAPASVPAPPHQVVSRKDLSIGSARRYQVRVSVPRHYERQSIELIAKAIVADVTAAQAVNALSILFYGPGTSTEGAYDIAKVDWAPNGQWGDALSARAGDYSSFRYTVSYNSPMPTQRSGLTRSSKTGLLGAPLPEGATLLDKRPADDSRDARERYSISSSAADLSSFFASELLAAGWEKDGAPQQGALFFRRGSHKLAVLINGDGKTFVLMGA